MNTKEKYNQIAKNYTERLDYSPERKYVFDPTMEVSNPDIGVDGSIKGRSVLDLACGNGNYTRYLKKQGASVVGVDLSEEMIKLAREEEKKNPLGIEYLVHDVKKLPKLGEFDMITAVFLLHYAKTKKELNKMCKNIHKNLASGGLFVTLNANPDYPYQFKKELGNFVTTKYPLEEGSEINITLFDKKGKLDCVFTNYQWSTNTYNESLKKAGFRQYMYLDPVISKEGIKKFGKEFWEEYKKNPHVKVIWAF